MTKDPYNREAYLRDADQANREYTEMLLGSEDDLVKQYFQADVRAEFDRHEATDNVLVDVSHERSAQYAKWGQQDHPDSLSNYPLVGYSEVRHMTAAELADRAKEIYEDDAAAMGEVNWQNILLEEVFETLEAAQRERHPEDLRAELVQVAAVAVAWVEAIDRREAKR